MEISANPTQPYRIKAIHIAEKLKLKDLRERAVIATSPRARGAVTKLFSHLLITNATSKDPSIPHDVRVVFTETNIDAVKVIKGKGRSVPQGGYGTKTSGFIVVETRKGEAFKAVLFLFAKTTTKVVAATSAEDMMHDSNISLSLFSGRDFLKSRKAMLSRPSKMVLSDTV